MSIVVRHVPFARILKGIRSGVGETHHLHERPYRRRTSWYKHVRELQRVCSGASPANCYSKDCGSTPSAAARHGEVIRVGPDDQQLVGPWCILWSSCCVV